MHGLKEVMVSTLMLLLLINSFCPATHAAPQGKVEPNSAYTVYLLRW